jgi:feruloyl esterase
MLCKAGQDPRTCLDPAQAHALDTVYGGVRNPRTGQLIYPAEMKGSEAIFGAAFSDPNAAKRPVPVDLARWVFGAQFDGAAFDFDKDMAREDAALGPIVNDNDPDLTKFAARGGKLILFHGWADAVVSPLDTVIYYERIATARGAPDKNQFVRLFMAPGMSHCAGGAGPDQFGQGAEFKSGDPDHDLLAALDQWAQTGKAPESVIASRAEGDGNPFAAPSDGPIVATRPLCAFPEIARYDGRGDPAKASSFQCSAAPLPKVEWPAPQYLR